MPKNIRPRLLALLMLPYAPISAAPIVPVPEHIPGATTVSAEQLITLAERLPDLVLVDSRIPEDRKQGYIDHSVNLPDINTSCDTLGLVIPDKASPALFYCNGVKCGRSVVAVKVALQCGYNDVYWFRGGFEEWQNKQYLFVQE